MVYLLPRGPRCRRTRTDGNCFNAWQINLKAADTGCVSATTPASSLGLAANFIHLIPSGSHRISLCHGTLPGGLWLTQSVDSSQQVSEGQRPLKQCTISLGCLLLFVSLTPNLASVRCTATGMRRQGQPGSPLPGQSSPTTTRVAPSAVKMVLLPNVIGNRPWEFYLLYVLVSRDNSGSKPRSCWLT